MNVSDVTRAKIDILLAISWCDIFEQFDLVSAGCPHYRELDLSALHARDFFRHLTGLMCPMRKFQAQNLLPEVERAFKIRNRNAGVIGGDDLELFAHILGGTRSPLRVAKIYSASWTLF